MALIGTKSGPMAVNVEPSNYLRRATVNDITSPSWSGIDVPGYFASMEYDLIHRGSPMIYSVVRSLRSAATQLPVRALKVENGVKVDDEDSDFALLMARPSNKCNSVEFWSWIYTMFFVHGRAVCYLRRNGAKVVELVRIHPGRVCRFSRGNIEGLPEGWYIMDNFGEWNRVERRDLLIISMTDTQDPTGAMSPLEPLRETIENDERARLAASAIWRNGGKPSFVLKHPGKFSKSSKGAINGLARQFKDKHGGVENWGMPLILEEGMEVQPLSIDDNLQYEGVRKFSRSEALGAYGLSLSHIGILEGSTYSNVAENEKAIYRRTMAPHLNHVEAAIEFDVRDGSHDEVVGANFPSGHSVQFDMDAVLRGDYETRTRVQSLEIQGGIATSNEIRGQNGRPPKEGGDVLVVNQALAPIDEVTGNRMGNASGQTGDDPKQFSRKEKDSLLGQLSRLAQVDEVDAWKFTGVVEDTYSKGVLVGLLFELSGQPITTLRERVKSL